MLQMLCKAFVAKHPKIDVWDPEPSKLHCAGHWSLKLDYYDRDQESHWQDLDNNEDEGRLGALAVCEDATKLFSSVCMCARVRTCVRAHMHARGHMQVCTHT